MSPGPSRAHRAKRATGELPPRWRNAAFTIAAVGLLAALLGLLAWTRPVDRLGTAEDQPAPSMTFAYSAAVPRSAAYDGTTADSPDPVFRELANDVEVRYTYQGEPGSVSVSAELSTASGWHSVLPLADAVAFAERRYAGVVQLDLAAIDKRAAAAAKVIGIPAGPVSVRVVPRVTTSQGTAFAPALALTLSNRTLALAGDAKSLQTSGVAVQSRPILVPGSLALFGRDIVTVAAARVISAALALVSLLAALALVIAIRRAEPIGEAIAIRRRFGSLLVSVQPMPSPPGRPVVNVTEFKTLARLAERYELLIMHWSRNNTETFVLQDEGTTYIYRCETASTGQPPGDNGGEHEIAALESREH